MGTGTGLMAGGGIAGTLAALPMPLGSLIEPLSPRAFPGPGGMPLTPASWAGDLDGAARRPRTATVSNAALPVSQPRENIETRRAWLMSVIPSRLVIILREQLGKRRRSSHAASCCLAWKKARRTTGRNHE